MAKTKRIFLTILIFLFFTVALLTIFISGIDDKTEKNTTLYSATINDIFVRPSW